ncbi:MAG: hypothetical protein J6X20_06885 [Bacteroidales bacterium]|nr:hypothetical protein [Bacteroidales bacterium]
MQPVKTGFRPAGHPDQAAVPEHSGENASIFFEKKSVYSYGYGKGAGSGIPAVFFHDIYSFRLS